MKKYDLHNFKSIIKYMIYVTSVVTACYGFWGCLFPDLTLVGGTYRVIYENAENSALNAEYDGDKLYADLLEGKVTVVYRSRLWEIIKSKCGLGND
jgi:hypothetical protein